MLPRYAIKGEAELDDVRSALFDPSAEPDVDDFAQHGNDAGDKAHSRGDHGDKAHSKQDDDWVKKTPLDDSQFDCVTLSGFLCCLHGEIPATGDVIRDSGFSFTVVHSDDRRVREVLAEQDLPDLQGVGDDASGTGDDEPRRPDQDTEPDPR